MSITIVLVEIQLAHNLGAVARVMKNFSLSQLRLVSPCFDHTQDQALLSSAGADDVILKAPVFPTLEEALKPFHRVYGTGANEREIIQTYLTPLKVVEELKKENRPQNIAIVFGPERTGLRNEHYALCHKIIQIPVNEDFNSLNISHAVGILAYELSFLSTQKENEFMHLGQTNLATHEDVQYFIHHLEQQLDRVNFWREPSKKNLMLKNITAFFNRPQFTKQDLQSLRGMLRSLSR